MAPVSRSYGLGDDFGYNENEYGHHGAHHSEPFVSKHDSRLAAHSGGAQGVGNRIERKDCSDRPGRILLEFFHQRGRLVAFLFTHCDKRNRSAHQRRFQNGA